MGVDAVAVLARRARGRDRGHGSGAASSGRAWRSCWGGAETGWMGSHCDADDTATMMGEDDEHEQQSMRNGRHDEEIGGRDVVDVIARKARQVWDGGRWPRPMYLATVA